MPRPLDKLSPLPRSVERWIDWFLPEHLRGIGEEERRARAVIVSSFSLFVAALIMLVGMREFAIVVAGTGVVVPHPEVLTLLFAMLVSFTVAYIVRKTGTARSAGWFLTLAVFAIIFQFSVDDGGFWSSTVWWLSILPVVGAFVGGPKVLVASTVSAIVLLWGLYSQSVHVIVPSPDVGADSPDAPSLLASRTSLILFSSFLGWYYEQLGTRASHQLQASNDSLKALNDELRVSRMHLRQVAENIGHAVWLEDPPSGSLLYVNGSFSSLYGLPPSALKGDLGAWKRTVVPADLDRVPTRPDGEESLYRVTRNGVERWVRHACIQAEGNNRRIIHIAADATLKRHEEALRSRFLEAILEVQESERRHLARELHDETGQALTALLVGLRAIREGLDERRQAHIDVLSTQLRHVVADVSRLARGLHPSILDELGLSAGVERLGQDLRAAHHVDVDVRTAGREHEDELGPQERLTTYRITQEALTNIARHARARRVVVDLSIDPATITLVVQDDGRGFDLEEVTGTSGGLGLGLGVYGMQERAQLLGGDVDISSRPGGGTVVKATIPRAKKPEAARPPIR